MTAKSVLSNAKKFLKSNSPELLTGTAVAGVLATGYLSAVAGYRASEALFKADDNLDKKEQAKVTWKFYIPAAAVGATTIVCIIGANRASSNRTAAAVAAYSLTERAFQEYREKVVEEIGEGKERKIRDEVATDIVQKTAPNSEVIIAGSGHVLCCELMTRRYFRSDMETLRRAQNDINAAIISDLYVTLDEFYDLVGLAHTTHSSELGWDSDKMMELTFTTAMTPANEPCLAFDYNYIKPLD